MWEKRLAELFFQTFYPFNLIKLITSVGWSFIGIIGWFFLIIHRFYSKILKTQNILQ